MRFLCRVRVPPRRTAKTLARPGIAAAAPRRRGGSARWRRRVLAGVFAASVPTALASQPAPAGEALSAGSAVLVRGEVERMTDGLPFPGVAVGIVRDGQLVFAEGVGLADPGSRTPVTDSTLFEIGSTTKAFTATLLGILVERGKLGFEDRLSDHLPRGTLVAGSAEGAGMTLAQLGSHYAGLPTQPPTMRTAADEPTQVFSHFELYRSLETAELVTPPGTAWRYSNLGYAALGLVLERTTGLPYEVLLERELSDPLRMRETTITLWPDLAPRLATPHRLSRDGAIRATVPENMGAQAPAGGVVSSVRDLAKFITLYLGTNAAWDAILSRPAREELYRARWRAGSGPIGYGLGWGLTSVEGVGDVVFHDGGMFGHTSYIGFSVDRRVGSIVLANLGGETGAPVRELGQRLLQIAASAEP